LAWQALVHHDLDNLQPEPLRQFFNAHGQPLKLKAGASTIALPRGAKTLLQRTSTGLNGRTDITLAEMKYPLYRCITVTYSCPLLSECRLVWSTSGIRRDEVSMSRFSFRNLNS